MGWAIASIVVLLTVGYLLCAPLFIEIDSTVGLFRIRFHRLASATLTWKEGTVWMRINLVLWQREYDLLKLGKRGEPKTEKRAAVNKRRSFSYWKMRNKVNGIVRSFYVTKCQVLIDTGDMPLNGMLYPWFYLLSRRIGKTVSINFWGENVIILQIENSLGRILRAYIQS